MIIPFEWEPIDSPRGEAGLMTSLAKVFGGWIVKEESYVDNEDNESFTITALAMTFIPDCDHEWEIA